MAPVIYFVDTAMSVSSVSFGLWPNLPSKDQTDWQNILCVQCAAALTVEAAHDHSHFYYPVQKVCILGISQGLLFAGCSKHLPVDGLHVA